MIPRAQVPPSVKTTATVAAVSIKPITILETATSAKPTQFKGTIDDSLLASSSISTSQTSIIGYFTSPSPTTLYLASTITSTTTTTVLSISSLFFTGVTYAFDRPSNQSGSVLHPCASNISSIVLSSILSTFVSSLSECSPISTISATTASINESIRLPMIPSPYSYSSFLNKTNAGDGTTMEVTCTTSTLANNSQSNTMSMFSSQGPTTGLLQTSCATSCVAIDPAASGSQTSDASAWAVPLSKETIRGSWRALSKSSTLPVVLLACLAFTVLVSP